MTPTSASTASAALDVPRDHTMVTTSSTQLRTDRTSPTHPGQWSRAPAHTSRAVSARSTTRFSHASSIASHDAMKLGRNNHTLRRTGTKALATNANDSTPRTSNSQLMGASLPPSVPQSRPERDGRHPRVSDGSTIGDRSGDGPIDTVPDTGGGVGRRHDLRRLAATVLAITLCFSLFGGLLVTWLDQS